MSEKIKVEERIVPAWEKKLAKLHGKAKAMANEGIGRYMNACLKAHTRISPYDLTEIIEDAANGLSFSRINASTPRYQEDSRIRASAAQMCIDIADPEYRPKAGQPRGPYRKHRKP